MVIPKASKIGVTEMLFLMLFAWGIQGKNGMYVLPTDPVRNRLVSTRIDPIIGATPLYRKNCRNSRKAVDSRSLKTIFRGNWNFVGSRSPDNFYEFDADVLIFDEYNKCNPGNIGLAMDRIGAAENQTWRKVGNPSISDYGIDAEYKNSDMRHWMLKCPHCNQWQYLDWFTHFVRQDDNGEWLFRDTSHSPLVSGVKKSRSDPNPVCSSCSGTLDRLAPGEWVPEYRDRPIRGYIVDRLFGAPGNDFDKERPIIQETMGYWKEAQGNPTLLQIFYNNRLALNFEAAGSKLTMAILSACRADYTMPPNTMINPEDDKDIPNIVAGVDVGGRLHLHISIYSNNKRRKIFIGTARDWDDLHQICERYHIRRGVIDALPQTHSAEKWCREHRGWYRAFYSKTDSADILVNVNHANRTIHVNRTASLDESYAAYINKQVEIPKDWRHADGGDFVKQMLASTRVFDEEKFKYIWDEGAQADHHFHADNYERIASSMIASGSLIT